MISRRPSVLTATAIIAATETMRPPSRTLQIGGVEPQIRPLALDRPVEEGVDPLIDVLAQLETWLFEMPLSPIACTSSSTRRVDTPPIQASWITVTSAFSAVLRGSRNGGKYEPLAQLGDAQLQRAEARVEAAVAIAVRMMLSVKPWRRPIISI